MSENQPHVGGIVVYTDPTGIDHDALCTAVWTPSCINVVFISGDEAKTDPYGRQIERETSVSKAGPENVAWGRCFRMPGEPKPEVTAPQEG